MPVNFDLTVLKPVMDKFARPVTIHPLKSQPGGGAYSARAIWHIDEFVEIGTEGGGNINTADWTLAARLSEYPTPPIKDDRVDIPADPAQALPAIGLCIIDEVHDDGVGGTTWILKKV